MTPAKHSTRPVLRRLLDRPLFKPRAKLAWEAGGAFSPAVVKTDSGYIMLYRAFSRKRISSLGLATSTDGLEWRRADEPVIVPSDESERWGVEDPRLVMLDGRLIVSYTAANGHDQADGWHWTTRIHLAVSTVKQQFHEAEKIVPQLPDLNNKDGVIFPEKIDGSYWMLHRLMPDIWISRSKDLTHWTDHCRIVEPIPETWQSMRIGAGAPPIRTELGWLVFHHGVDEDLTYSMSALVLELENPAEVRYRLPYPLLVPEASYELEGVVPNVVFGTGATDEGDTFRLYYGAADRVVAAAEINKADLFEALRAYPASSAPPLPLPPA